MKHFLMKRDSANTKKRLVEYYSLCVKCVRRELTINALQSTMFSGSDPFFDGDLYLHSDLKRRVA